MTRPAYKPLCCGVQTFTDTNDKLYYYLLNQIITYALELSLDIEARMTHYGQYSETCLTINDIIHLLKVLIYKNILNTSFVFSLKSL